MKASHTRSKESHSDAEDFHHKRNRHDRGTHIKNTATPRSHGYWGRLAKVDEEEDAGTSNDKALCLL